MALKSVSRSCGTGSRTAAAGIETPSGCGVCCPTSLSGRLPSKRLRHTGATGRFQPGRFSLASLLCVYVFNHGGKFYRLGFLFPCCSAISLPPLAKGHRPKEANFNAFEVDKLMGNEPKTRPWRVPRERDRFDTSCINYAVIPQHDSPRWTALQIFGYNIFGKGRIMP